MVNRLVAATSPYLLQHAENPVHWWEWGPEAFAEARRRDIPILLSVGYAACHWCHVMAHESFEDDAIAAVINAGFVPVKVDREERPDVDAVYMQATTAMTGHGGWPMTVFCTPTGEPFYAGTYYPPRPAHGMPAFGQILDAISAAWTDRRDEVAGSAAAIVEQLGARTPELTGTLAEADLTAARTQLQAEFDPRHAGFGRAPKFPPSMVLEGLLRLAVGGAGGSGDQDALAMVTRTCEAMARGGIYDQLGGGFARYSVDAAWVVPHFEKMLYDNALLLGVYTHWGRRTADPLAERVVAETVDWLLREMRTPQGGFAASLDADSLDASGHTHEGAYYAWTPAELESALGPEDGAWAAQAYEVTAAGTFEHGASTLQRLVDPDPDRLAAVADRLRAVRDERPRPGRDDKVVAAWNGWLVEALVRAAHVFDRPEWLTAATAAADLLWRVHWVGGDADTGTHRLRRTSRDGVVGTAPGILEDYAALALAAVRLGGALGDATWIERARTLLAVVTEQFPDGRGGYFDSAADAERLWSRPQDPTDNATPSGLSTLLMAQTAFAEVTGEAAAAEAAEAAARSVAELVRRAPRFAGWILADAVSRVSGGGVQVAVAGGSTADRADLVRTAFREAPAGSVVVAGTPDAPGLALLADRPLVGGRPTAYVCRGFVCRLPVTTAHDLVAQLRS
ncbi:MAG: thioredoxin domain-containing protein [Propionibacteriaceae bacterium]